MECPAHAVRGVDALAAGPLGLGEGQGLVGGAVVSQEQGQLEVDVGAALLEGSYGGDRVVVGLLRLLVATEGIEGLAQLDVVLGEGGRGDDVLPPIDSGLEVTTSGVEQSESHQRVRVTGDGLQGPVELGPRRIQAALTTVQVGGVTQQVGEIGAVRRVGRRS